MFKSVYFFLGLIVCSACKVSPPPHSVVGTAQTGDKVEQKPAYIFSFLDPVVQDIYQVQYARDISALTGYLTHSNSHYREMAARAMGSFQNLGYQPVLAEALLRESNLEVEQLMVFAIGQTRNPDYFSILYRQLLLKKEPALQEAYLSALGKCATEATIGQLTAYQPTNAAAAYGQLYGIFQAGTQKIKPPIMQPVFDNLSISRPERNRVLAATYLARFPFYDYTPFTLQLVNSLQFDPLPWVRAQTALALAHSNDRLAANTLQKVFQQDGHPQVKRNVLKALMRFHGPETNSIAEAALLGTDPLLSETAALYFVEKGGKASAAQYLKWLPNVPNLSAKALLIRAAIAQGYQTKALEAWGGLYQKTTQLYEKVQLFKALQGATASIPKLIALHKTESHVPVKTALLETIASTLTNTAYFEKNPKTYQEVARLFHQALLSKDAGAVCTVVPFFQPGPRGMAAHTGVDAAQLSRLRQELHTYQYYEAYLAVGEVLKQWGLVEAQSMPLSYHLEHIHWEQLSQLGPAPKILVATNKGPITMQLLPKVAPFTVMSILHLVKTNFYNGKAFHRVVTDFVAQAGCPRGDGYGGVDFMLRSEFSEHSYLTQGMVGMASAGPDTESSQWFINTAPTPHLDGRYTIFAQILSGFEVAEKLQQGDWIEKVEILKEY